MVCRGPVRSRARLRAPWGILDHLHHGRGYFGWVLPGVRLPAAMRIAGVKSRIACDPLDTL